MESTKELTEAQKRAAELLADGMQVQEVSNQLNVSRSTLWRWKKVDAFQKALNRVNGTSEGNPQSSQQVGREAVLNRKERSLDQFIDECISSAGEEDYIPVQTVYNEYVKYCETHDLVRVSLTKMKRKFEEEGGITLRNVFLCDRHDKFECEECARPDQKYKTTSFRAIELS